jgi:hypothetical protein
MACHPSTPREWLVRLGWVVVSSPSFVECHPPSFVGCRPHHSSSVVPRRLSGVVPVVCRVSSPVIRRRSTRGPPHEQLLMRLGAGGASSSVVHCCRPQSFVIPRSFVVCRLRLRMALVHPQSTRRAVARQRGGGCSVDRRCRPCRCRPPLSLFVVVVRCHCSLSLSSMSLSFPVVFPHCRPLLSSFVVVLVPILVPVLVPVLVVCPRRLSSLSPSLSLSSSLFHPQSTPRAVAREAGGRWRCRHRGWWR